MRIVRAIKQMVQISKGIRLNKHRIGFVPTMGALHEGHLSLIRQARKENDFVVVSIFVNPTQFGPKEDFTKYPRDLNSDAKMCKNEGVDLIFAPSAKDMFPDNYKTYVEVKHLSDVLCGKYRAGHFKGVATVVSKLFNIIQPDIAYFGQKDAQQAIIIKKLTEDLNIPVEIKVMPTVREESGLAMSSRNKYLNEKEKKAAVGLHEALNKAQDLINKGKKDYQEIIRQVKAVLNKNKIKKIDYISIVDLQNLQSLSKIKGGVLVALAAWVGKTRLIDNIIINSK